MVTSKYGPDTPVLDFCVDLLLGSGERIAVTCDLCKGKKVKGAGERDWPCYRTVLKVVCVNICCPHGASFKPQTFGDRDYACQPDSVHYQPAFYSREGDLVDFLLGRDFLLTAPAPAPGLPYPLLYKVGDSQLFIFTSH